MFVVFARGRAIGSTMAIWLASLVCAPLFALTADELAAWAEGPIQWLLLAEERKQLKRVSEGSEASRFIDDFWARRDRDPLRSGNEYRNEFIRRVEAADTLYDGEGVRGSLTDRGRALILMGPPTQVTVSTEPVMTWDPASRDQDRVTMRDVNVEFWAYRMEDLPAGFVDILLQRGKKAQEDTLALTLMFRTVGRQTSLIEGEALLEAAALAAVRPDQRD